MAEARQGARLVEEALQPPFEIVLRAARAGGDVGQLQAQGEIDRQVFLDRQLLVQGGVFGEIGDAEAAAAQHALDAILRQPKSRRQRLRIIVGVCHGVKSNTVKAGRV